MNCSHKVGYVQFIVAKVADTQELRKELQNVKKLARERAKAITLRIPQLKDCKNHFDKKKEEGSPRGIWQQSHSRLLLADYPTGQGHDGLYLRRPVRRRLVHEPPRVLAHGHQNNQAVFVLKGKPLNVWDLTRNPT